MSEILNVYLGSPQGGIICGTRYRFGVGNVGEKIARQFIFAELKKLNALHRLL